MANRRGVKRHARLGPSSSDIWLACQGAPAEWAKYPPRKVGFAAHEGTLAHTLCEAALSLNAVPWREGLKFNVEGDEVTVDQEMLNCVLMFASTTASLSDFSYWRAVEEEVDLAWLWGDEEPPEIVYGTLDFAACDGVVLYVIDFKYGRGRAVKVEGNTQLLCYALGIYNKLQRERPDLAASIETISLAIIQPRAGGQPIRQWSIPVADLLYWGYSTLKPAVDAINNGAQPALVAGNHCYFCPARDGCPEYRRYKVQRSIESFPEWFDDDEEGIM